MSIWASFEDANLPVIFVQVKNKTTSLFIQNYVPMEHFSILFYLQIYYFFYMCFIQYVWHSYTILDWKTSQQTLAAAHWNPWFTYNCHIAEELCSSCTSPGAAGDWEGRQRHVGQVCIHSSFSNAHY